MRFAQLLVRVMRIPLIPGLAALVATDAVAGWSIRTARSAAFTPDWVFGLALAFVKLLDYPVAPAVGLIVAMMMMGWRLPYYRGIWLTAVLIAADVAAQQALLAVLDLETLSLWAVFCVPGPMFAAIATIASVPILRSLMEPRRLLRRGAAAAAIWSLKTLALLHEFPLGEYVMECAVLTAMLVAAGELRTEQNNLLGEDGGVVAARGISVAVPGVLMFMLLWQVWGHSNLYQLLEIRKVASKGSYLVSGPNAVRLSAHTGHQSAALEKITHLNHLDAAAAWGFLADQDSTRRNEYRAKALGVCVRESAWDRLSCLSDLTAVFARYRQDGLAADAKELLAREWDTGLAEASAHGAREVNLNRFHSLMANAAAAGRGQRVPAVWAEVLKTSPRSESGQEEWIELLRWLPDTAAPPSFFELRTRLPLIWDHRADRVADRVASVLESAKRCDALQFWAQGVPRGEHPRVSSALERCRAAAAQASASEPSSPIDQARAAANAGDYLHAVEAAARVNDASTSTVWREVLGRMHANSKMKGLVADSLRQKGDVALMARYGAQLLARGDIQLGNELLDEAMRALDDQHEPRLEIAMSFAAAGRCWAARTITERSPHSGTTDEERQADAYLRIYRRCAGELFIDGPLLPAD